MKRQILESIIKEVLQEKSKGLWHNIRAKRERGDKPSHPNSKAFKSAVKAGERIKREQ